MGWQSTPVLTGTQALGVADGKLRFVWMTDGHVADLTGVNAANLRLAVEDCNIWRPNAIVHTGDMGNNTLYSTQCALALLRQAQRPLLWVIGNHDEVEAVSGVTNVADLEQALAFGQVAPFCYATTMTSGDGTLTALCLVLDCNLYDDSPEGDKDSLDHTPGARTGYYDINSGWWRQFGVQLAWVEAQLAARSSDIVLVFAHYPPADVTCTDYTALADVLQADGRPTIGFCGHTHQHGYVFTAASTDTLTSISFYKVPAAQESGGWGRVTLSFSGGAIVVDGIEVQHYTNPGGWTLFTPFTAAP